MEERSTLLVRVAALPQLFTAKLSNGRRRSATVSG
jgi:hypothetical protein